MQHPNHQSSSTLETDDVGAVISYEEYHPCGTTSYQAMEKPVRAAAKRYRYTGMKRDEETGLSYHSARYYISWLGRWLSPDPIGIGDGVNVYGYCKGNPVNGTDASGTQTSSTYVDVKIPYFLRKKEQKSDINTKGVVQEVDMRAATGGGSGGNVSPKGVSENTKETQFIQQSIGVIQMLTKSGAMSKEDGVKAIESYYPKPESSKPSGIGTLIKFLGGLFEAAAGVVFAETGGGVPFIWHGVDQMHSAFHERATGTPTATLSERIGSKLLQNAGFDKETADTFSGITNAGISMFAGGSGLFKGSGLAAKAEAPLLDSEIISVIGGNKPGTFLLREIDLMPIRNITSPGKSGSIAQSFDVRSEVQIAFGKPGTRGDILLQSTVGDIRAAGFDVLRAPTRKNPFHVRIISDSRTFDNEGTEWLNAAFQVMGKIKKTL